MSTKKDGSSKKALDVLFERPPYFSEIKPLEKEFNQLSGEYRHLIKRLIQTKGDMYRSLRDARLIDEVNKKFSLELPKETKLDAAMRAHGLTLDYIFPKLKDIAEGMEMKLDGKGQVVEVQNRTAQLKALEQLIKLAIRTEEANDKTTVGDAEQLFASTKL